MADTLLTGISGITTGINSLSNLILLVPNNDVGYLAQSAPIAPGTPQPEQRNVGLLFHYEGENTATLEADITDHFVESNNTISDQIAIKPDTVTVQGFVGELSDVIPDVQRVLNIVQSKLTTLSPYIPGVTTSTLIAINAAILAYQVIANAVSTVEQTFSSDPVNKLNKQQLYFAKFYGWFYDRALFTIQTPWRIWENMAIKSLRAIQSPDTRMITDFEITFKQINYVNPVYVVNPFQGRGAIQYNDPVNLGTNNIAVASNASPTSLITGIVG